jgi:predicted metal-dependent hydrolase
MTMTSTLTNGVASKSTSPSIKVRRREFDFDSVPRHWVAGRKSVTTFLDNLSTFFPHGERFFVAAVRAHEKFVTSDDLRAAVRGFCGQEGAHTKAHDGYNAMLARQGYPAEKLDAEIEKLLAFVAKVLPPRMRLSATCALEHMTALMAQMLTADDVALKDADPTMTSLWKWHAAEENEHKAVAFDVYKAAGAPYWERALMMIVASSVFFTKVIEHQVRMMRTDGTATSPREWWSLFHYVFVNPGTLSGIAPEYLQYFRPSFHPNDIDASALIAKWMREEGVAG